jgi:hypothetical protein
MHPHCLLLVAASVIAQPNNYPPFVVEHSQAMMSYYRNPDPESGPKMMKELLSKENIDHAWFKTDNGTHALKLMSAQLGDIAIGKPKLVREYESMFAGASPAGRRVIIRALNNCGDKETITKVDEWLKDEKVGVKSELEALKKHLEDPKRKQPRDLPAKTPDDLDFLWVNFFTTGEYAPISRLLDVFDDPKADDTMKRVAKWSLGSNLQQHPKLVELVQKHAKERPAASKKVIDELIIKAP